MLVVDPDRRFTIDQCLAHPWLNQAATNPNDSTGGLVGGIASLDVQRRGPVRERTLLSNLNPVQVAATVNGNKDRDPVKVFAKNEGHVVNAPKEEAPSHNREPAEFIQMGGKGDQELFGDDDASVYPGPLVGSPTSSRIKETSKGEKGLTVSTPTAGTQEEDQGQRR